MKVDNTKRDRLRECRALGTLAGMASGGVAFGAYFMAQLFDITKQSNLFVLDLIAGILVVSIFVAAFGGGGLFGRWAGEHIVYPVRVGNERPATRNMWLLVLAGLGVVGVFLTIAFLLSLGQAES